MKVKAVGVTSQCQHSGKFWITVTITFRAGIELWSDSASSAVLEALCNHFTSVHSTIHCSATDRVALSRTLTLRGLRRSTGDPCASYATASAEVLSSLVAVANRDT